MKSTFPCVDLKFEGNTIIQQGESRKGVLRFVDEDHFHFAENKVQHVIHPGASLAAPRTHLTRTYEREREPY